MTLTERFLVHPVAPNLLMILLIILGLWGFHKSPFRFLPYFDINVITIQVPWVGSTSIDVESSIIQPIEEELRSVDNVKKVTATASAGLGIIQIEFRENTDMSIALNQVEEQVARVRNLPQDAESPSIETFTLKEVIGRVLLSSPDGYDVLRPLAKQFERELLDAGIAKIEIRGLPEQEIAIEIASKQLFSMARTLPDIATEIAQRSADLPLGTIGQEEASTLLRTIQQKRTVYDYWQLPINTQTTGQLLHLGDIANIHYGPRDDEIFFTQHGKKAVVLDVMRFANSDALTNAKIMQNWYKKAVRELPSSVHMQIYDERWIYIQDRLNTLVNNGLQGLCLVLIILFLFLNRSVAFWTAVGIPTAFLGAFALFPLFGLSIDMISMFSLILVLGIVVDDAIVVAEEALTQFKKGLSAKDAALSAINTMFYPILSSSLTTVSAFMPLLILSGSFGQLMGTLPNVVIVVLIASLIECFLILPGHLCHSFSAQHSRKESVFRVKIDDWVDELRNTHFKNLVSYAITHGRIVLALSLGFLIIALVLVASNRIPFNFFPTPEGNRFHFLVKFHAGTDPDKVDEFIQSMEAQIWAIDKASSEPILKTTVVTHRALQTDQIGAQERGDNYASISMEVLPSDQRKMTIATFGKDITHQINKPPEVEEILIELPRGGPPGKDIEITLTGNEPLQLKQAASALEEILRTYRGVNNIQNNLPYGKQELILSLTDRAKQIGLKTTDVAQQLRSALTGELVQIFYDDNREIEVRVRLPNEERYQFALLSQFPIVTPQGQLVPIGNFVHMQQQPGLQLLRHFNYKLSVNVTADVDNAVNNNNLILSQLQQGRLLQLANQYKVQYSLEGRSGDQRQTFQDMRFGLIIGTTLIYIILAWVFASYVWPFIVLFIVPFGVAGAIYGHLIMGLNLTMLSLFGFFGLAGIVINDSIILVNAYKQIIQHNPDIDTREAVISAACHRFRAVCLTSLTTIAGLTPLLFETSTQAQFLIPMAASIAFGIASATLLILLLMPSILYAYESRYR